jgi:hypothetical protein
MSRIARASVVALLAAVWMIGCAKERPPRSYVQPNILAKADLEGEWYYVPTVVDINLGHSVTFVGEAGWSVNIVKWDVQENVLYARLAYDRIDHTTSYYNDPNFKGEVIGAWAIQKQFDIIRDYNATTGEETNTIRESTERPWYEREFLRVDWSENLVSNWEGLMWQRAVTTDPINYIITDPNHPHAPKIERDDEGEANFINITNKVLVTPEMRDVEWDFLGLSQIPDCFFYGTLSSCTSTEVTVRHAFWKKDPDKEYEPLEYTQRDMEDFGYFTTQRLYYNDYYGVTIGGMKWLANRFNLWKESFNKAYTLTEARRFQNQCPEVIGPDGQPQQDKFYCPDDGGPCRCIANDKKVYITSEIAYTYSDLDEASPDEAEVFAAAQCAGGQYDCGGDTCTCTDGGDVIYKLAFRAEAFPQQLLGKDGVVCPCDDPASSAWECDPDKPQPCFHKVDGTTVHYATGSGKLRYPLRYHERELRTIPYYANPDMPENIRQQTHGVVGQWAEVFDAMVWRLSGCEAAGLVLGEDRCEARPEFDANLPNSQEPEFHTFLFCPNNPVQEDDHPACGPAGREIVPGDIRYNYIHWWRPPQQAAPLGYGPPLADPLTGETISAISNIYGASMESYSAYARDIVRMLTDENFQWLDFLHGYLQQSIVRKMQHDHGFRMGKSAVPAKSRSWEKKRWTRQDVRKLYNQMDMSWTASIQSSVKPDFSSREGITNFMKAQGKVIARSGVFGNGQRPDLARMNLLRNSYIEDMMMTNEMLLNRAPTLISAGYSPDQLTMLSGPDLGYGTDVRRKVSPLTWLNVNYIKAINKIKFSHFANTHMYAEFVPFEEPSTIGIAQEVVEHNCGCDLENNPEGCASVSMTLTERWDTDPLCAEKVREELKVRIYDPVAVHEMGHNLGLRHNFKGSFDALNYADEYWDMRVQSAQQQGEVIKERWEQPRTDWENVNKITDYQWASIMDYGAKFNSDFNGLGKWDVAAINYGYGKLIQVFDELNPDPNVDPQSTLGLIQTFRSFSWPTPITLGAEPRAVLQTRLHFDPENPATTPEGVVNTDDDNRMWRPKPWIVPANLGGDTAMVTSNALEPDARGRIMVPYKFCSDEFRNVSLGCNYFDEGADLFEITENQIQAYENYYVFNNWGRDRYTWGWDENEYTGRVWGRYFAILQNHMQYYALYRAIFENEWFENEAGVVDDFFVDDWAHFTISVARGFETFSRVLNQPAPGYYGCGSDEINRTAPDGTPYWIMGIETDWCPYEEGCVGDPNMGMCAMHVDLLNGKYWDDTWDFDMGYQWYFKRLRYGQFYDRPLAIQAMAEATNNFMGRDTQEDFRQYTINYARIYPDQLMELMGAIQSSDLSIAAPRVCEDGNGNYAIEHVDFSNMGEPECSSIQQEGTWSFTGTYLDPGHTFSTQLYAAVFGMTMFPMTYSQEFIDKWRVYVRGAMEGHNFEHCQDLATDGCEVEEFTDPLSQKTFYTVRYQDRQRAGFTYDVSIGARMVEYGNILRQNYEDELAACGGSPCQAGDANYDTFFRRKKELEDYVMNLEMIRSLTYTFEHPEYSGSAGL